MSSGAEGIVTRQGMTWGWGDCDILSKFQKHGANEHHRVIYMLWQSQAMLFVIMLCQRKTAQLNGHQRYGATAICRHVCMQLAPVLYGYGNLPVQKYATCSPAMRLRQNAGYGNTLATAKCRLRQNAGEELRDFLVPRLLEAVHNKGTIMLEICMQRRDA